jgi:hypothetical protein
MNRDVLAQYFFKCLLEAKQTHVRVGNPPKKPATSDKTKPLSFQKVGHENKQLEVTWFGHLVMPFGMGKCQSQHVLLHLEEYGDNHAINE